MQFLLLGIAPAFTNYVSAAAENSDLFRIDRIWGRGLGNKMSKKEHMPNGKLTAACQ